MKFFKILISLCLISILLSPSLVEASCWSDCDRKFSEWYQEPDRLRCKLECDLKEVPDSLHLGAQGCLWRAKKVRETNIDRRSNRGLNATEKYYLRPWFGDIVDKVEVMWGANLNDEIKVGGWTIAEEAKAQTFGYYIYMKERRNTGDPVQMIDLAHELFHTKQYVNYGESLERFCQKYMDGWTNAGLNYFDNPLERKAFDFDFRFAQWLGKEHNNLKCLPGDRKKRCEYTHGAPHNHRTTPIPKRLETPDLEPFAVTCIENKTNWKINYSVKWGDGKWESVSVEARRYRRHAWKYKEGSQSSPDLRITFDYDLSQNGIQNKSYVLKRYAAAKLLCESGKKYYFSRDGSNKIDLYSY